MKETKPVQHHLVEPASASGRVVTDNRGNRVWECKTDTGTFRHDADTQRTLKALHCEGLGLDEGNSTAPMTSFNPYDQVGARPTEDKPRKSLDDLRKLSEQIKQSRVKK